MTKSKVHISLGDYRLVCTAEEVAATFAWLLEEMRAAAPRLRADERAVLRRIMSQPSASLTVADVFPDFEREHEAHKTLRRLRAAQFIRPAMTGRWEPNEPIGIKPFGRVVWNQLGEAGIFGEVPESEPEREPESEPAEEEEVDLALADVNEPDEAETVRMTGKELATAWDDDDVLDFLKDPKSGPE